MYNIKNRGVISLFSLRTLVHTLLSILSLVWLVNAVYSEEQLLAHTLVIPTICFGSTTAYGIFNLFWVIERYPVKSDE